MTNTYPVTLSTRTPNYRRVQVLYRVLWLAAIGLMHQTVGGLFAALYVILPVVAAVSAAARPSTDPRADGRDALLSVVTWVVSFYSYLTFLSDRFPSSDDGGTQLVVRPSGTPSVGSALARLVTTLPHAVILFVLGFCAALVSVVMAITVLISETCPESLRTFQRDVVAWVGRVLAYHASLVDAYPPFTSGSDRTPVRS